MNISLNKIAVFLAASVATGAMANHATIHREVLATCYLADEPPYRQSLTGREGKSSDDQNPCYDGSYNAQTLSYAYQIRQTVLLVIENDGGPATSQTLTETTPTWQQYTQQNQCESRAQFALQAQEYFTDFKNYILAPKCAN